MTTAVEALAAQAGAATVDTPTTAGVDVSKFFLGVVSKDVNLKGMNVADSITTGNITRTMAGASTLEVTIFDPQKKLLNSGVFKYRLDVNVDGHFFRLVQVGKSADELTLTFEDRIISYLRQHTRPMKTARSKLTRAEFIRKMIKEVDYPIKLFSPELHKKQPLEAIKEPKRVANKSGGLDTGVGLKIKGQTATRPQIKFIEAVLDEGVAMGAPRKVLIAAVMVVTQESSASKGATNGTHVGGFQQDSSPGTVWRQLGGATRNPTKDAHAFFSVAIKENTNNPSLPIYQLCENVQRSGLPKLYDKWRKESTNWVDEYGQTGGATGISGKQYYKTFYFMRGAPDGPQGEDSWQAATRLAEEVNWRVFVVGNTFYYVADRDLINSKPVMTIDEDTRGIDQIDFDWDVNKRVNEATVTCRATRWFAPPGSVVRLKNLGPASDDKPYPGRWLVWEIDRDLFSEDTTITLRKPEKPKPEPLGALTTGLSPDQVITVNGRVTGPDGLRQKIVDAAEHAFALGSSKYRYAQIRPTPDSLFGKGTIRTDCSGFVTLCYKAAGAADPNGFGYNGSGNTSSLQGHGKRVSKPKLGDLVFYSNPEHVGVYVDNGQVIEFGSDPGPKKLSMNYRTVVQIRRYVLDQTVIDEKQQQRLSSLYGWGE